MPAVNIIKVSDLERANRLDAKFYHPKYLKIKTYHQQGKWLPIRLLRSKSDYGISRKMNTDGDGASIFRMDNLHGGFVFSENIKYTPVSESELEKYRLLKGDILFNRVNSEEYVGRTGIYKLDGEHVFASYLVRLRTNSSIEPDVLNLFLNSEIGTLSIQRLSRRAVNQANVNAQELQSILCPCFSDSLREKLVELSESSWELHDKANQISRQAEDELHKELGFIGWMPSRNLSFSCSSQEIGKAARLDAEHHLPRYKELRNRVRQYKHGYENLRNVVINSDEKENPALSTEDHFRYVELSNIDSNVGFIEETQVLFCMDAPSRARMVLREGDVILSRVEGSVDKVALVTKEHEGAIGSTGFFVLRPKSVDGSFMLALARSQVIQEQMRCEASGTILASVSNNGFNNIIVPSVPKSVRERISKLILKANKSKREAIRHFTLGAKCVDLAIIEGETKAMAYLVENC